MHALCLGAPISASYLTASATTLAAARLHNQQASESPSRETSQAPSQETSQAPSRATDQEASQDASQDENQGSASNSDGSAPSSSDRRRRGGLAGLDARPANHTASYTPSISSRPTLATRHNRSLPLNRTLPPSLTSHGSGESAARVKRLPSVGAGAFGATLAPDPLPCTRI